MAKRFKVKRYNRIYGRSPGSRLLHLLGAAAAVCVLGFIGWSAYGPVMDYLSGDTVKTMEPAVSSSESSSAQAVASQPERQNNSADESAQQEPAPEKEPSKPVAVDSASAVHGIYLPSDILSDASKLDNYLSSVDTTKFNSIYFDLKDDMGNVQFRSHVDGASLASQAFDLSSVCKQIKKQGFTPIGRISAFQDPLAASEIKNAGVKYGDSEILWNDDDPARGGKPWLNPYAAPAQEYIIALGEEAVGMGISKIVYTNVCFPTGFSLHLAGYGNVTQSRSEVLSAFIDQAEQRIADAGGTLWVYTDGRSALGITQNQFGDSNPISLSNETIILDARPAQFGNGLTMDNFTVNEPIKNPRETVDTLLESLKSNLTDKKVIAILQGTTADGGSANNKPYTAQDMEDQISALTDNNIEQYIFYSPDGNYPIQEAE